MRIKPDSKIYVAGHRGVAGHAIVQRLEQKGYRSVCVRAHAELDLTRQRDVEAFFEAERPEYVFFCAANMGGIAHKGSHPVEILLENLQMEANVFHAAHRYGVKKLLFMASAFLYPNGADQPYREESLALGECHKLDEPYYLAKFSGIRLCEYYAREYRCDFLAVLPCVFFGPGETFVPERSTVVPSMMRRMYDAKRADEETFTVWGSGKPLREFLYSFDVADASILCMESATEAGTYYNLGNGGNEVTIRDTAEVIRSVIGYSGTLRFDTEKPDGTYRKTLDSSRLFALGWRPKYTFEQGVWELYRYFLAEMGG